jgi:hypothetical protein
MIRNIYLRIIKVLVAPFYLEHFFQRKVGAHYGMGFWEKLRMVLRFRRNVITFQRSPIG